MLRSRPQSARMAIAVIAACTEIACLSGPKLEPMDPSRPIQTEHGYQQDEQTLDPADMTEKLGKEPGSASHIARARTLGTLSTILAIAGSGLIGWTCGEYASENGNPNWNLAYAGTGAMVVAIPLVLWSADSVHRGVEAHNRRFEPEPRRAR
jgi:hypothetical protein